MAVFWIFQLRKWLQGSSDYGSAGEGPAVWGRSLLAFHNNVNLRNRRTSESLTTANCGDVFEKLIVVHVNRKLVLPTERKCMLHLFTCSDYSVTEIYIKPFKYNPLCPVSNIFLTIYIIVILLSLPYVFQFFLLLRFLTELHVQLSVLLCFCFPATSHHHVNCIWILS